jgi:hypothetical protein
MSSKVNSTPFVLMSVEDPTMCVDIDHQNWDGVHRVGPVLQMRRCKGLKRGAV